MTDNWQPPEGCDEHGSIVADLTDLDLILRIIDDAGGLGDAIRSYILVRRDLQYACDEGVFADNRDGTPKDPLASDVNVRLQEAREAAAWAQLVDARERNLRGDLSRADELRELKSKPRSA